MAERRRLALLASLAAALSTAATLAAAELALRIRHGGVGKRPISASGGRSLMTAGGYPIVHDPLLGYAPRPGARGSENIWGRQVTIDAAGLRENGAPRPPGAPILALGDSFTFGDELDDADTWPARLEALIGRPVLNGGVFGYGVDQMVLRAEQLLSGVAAAADLVILDVLPEDVLRCEFSYRYAWKPYFALENDVLALRNVPVPQPHEGPPGESALRRMLRHSFVADRVFRALDPDGWSVPDSVRVHRDGPEVASRLLDRLLTRAQGEGRSLLLVIQWMPGIGGGASDELAERARNRGVTVLELRRVLEPVVAARGAAAVFFVHSVPGHPETPSHMNPAGNRLAAEAIAALVRTLADS